MDCGVRPGGRREKNRAGPAGSALWNGGRAAAGYAV